MDSNVLKLYKHYKEIGYDKALNDLLIKFPDLEKTKEEKTEEEEKPKEEEIEKTKKAK